MTHRIAWVDTETSGLDPEKNDVVQIAIMIEEEGEIVESANIKLRPHPNSLISDAALRITNTTREEIAAYQPQFAGLHEFKSILHGYVSPYDKREKLIIAGYNVKFDVDMLNSAFLKNDDKYFFSWFFSCFLDVKSNVAEYMIANDIALDNYKLSTVCDHFDISFQAHDAMEDITATRELYKAIKNAVTA